MEKAFLNKLFQSHQDCPECPTPEKVAQFFNQTLGILFPDYATRSYDKVEDLEYHVQELKADLNDMLYLFPNSDCVDIKNKAQQFLDKLPQIYSLLLEDITAVYEGDPAARSESEVIKSYPGFYAIAAYRMAHELFLMDVKLIPRMITEHAHGKTGIDIHPGAKIGKRFCIDHGTGIVIGETTEIGNNVKIYQGVTLGALSVSKSDASSKRHPTIEDDVVLYSGATVLGGHTVIGKSSIIGGNTWITKSVEPNSKIYYQGAEQNGTKKTERQSL